jgi:WD40 repeat protein
MSRRCAPLCLLLALLAPGPAAHGQQPPRRLDRHGDPLPDGALQRLGQVARLRQGGAVTALALSPDGKVLASAGARGTVCLWEVPSGQELRVLTGHLGPVHAVAFSPDGKTLASAAADGSIRFWETGSGQHVARCFTLAGIPAAVAFSPDGKLLLSGGNYQTRSVRMWRPSAEIEADHSFFTSDPVTAVAFAPNGKTVVSVHLKGNAVLWDAGSARPLRELASDGPVATVRFSPDGKSLFTAEAGGFVTVREVATGGLRDRFQAHTRLFDLVLSADGRTLATRGADGIKVWDVPTRRQVRRYPAGSDRPVTALALSGDGKLLVTGSAGGRIHFLGVGAAPPGAPADQTPVRALAVSPDGRVVATQDHERIRLWEVRTGKPLRSFPAKNGQFHCVAFAPVGRLLAAGEVGWEAGDGQSRLRVWDRVTGKEAWSADLTGGEAVRLAFAPDGKTLLALTRDRHVSVRDAATGKELRRARLTQLSPSPPAGAGFFRAFGGAPAPAGPVQSEGGRLALAADGRTAALAPAQGPAEIWDLHSGLKLGQVGKVLDRFVALAFTPDGRGLLTASVDEEICWWEVATRQLRLRLPAPRRLFGPQGSGPLALAFSPDGRVLAVSRPDLAVALWDTATAAELTQLRGHRDLAADLAFSPDGSSLVSGSLDATALVWDLRGLRPGNKAPVRLSEADLESAWGLLARADPAPAHARIGSLVEAPAQAVAFLKGRLRPVAAPARTAEEMVADLGHARYRVREKATADLARLGERARPALTAALEGDPPLETRRRAEKLLRELGESQLPPDQLRALRALEVLERIASPPARQLLEAVARGDGAALLTLEARAALARLRHRRAASP